MELVGEIAGWAVVVAVMCANLCAIILPFLTQRDKNG